jgi:hypothetical protein
MPSKSHAQARMMAAAAHWLIGPATHCWMSLPNGIVDTNGWQTRQGGLLLMVLGCSTKL